MTLNQYGMNQQYGMPTKEPRLTGVSPNEQFNSKFPFPKPGVLPVYAPPSLTISAATSIKHPKRSESTTEFFKKKRSACQKYEAKRTQCNLLLLFTIINVFSCCIAGIISVLQHLLALGIPLFVLAALYFLLGYIAYSRPSYIIMRWMLLGEFLLFSFSVAIAVGLAIHFINALKYVKQEGCISPQYNNTEIDSSLPCHRILVYSAVSVGASVLNLIFALCCIFIFCLLVRSGEQFIPSAATSNSPTLSLSNDGQSFFVSSRVKPSGLFNPSLLSRSASASSQLEKHNMNLSRPFETDRRKSTGFPGHTQKSSNEHLSSNKPPRQSIPYYSSNRENLYPPINKPGRSYKDRFQKIKLPPDVVETNTKFREMQNRLQEQHDTETRRLEGMTPLQYLAHQKDVRLVKK